jgi:polygalacturonase
MDKVFFGFIFVDIQFTTINFLGSWWWAARKAHKLKFGRPRLLETMFCDHVKIQHVHLHNSPFWTTHLYASRYLEVYNITVYAPWDSPETDGIDPDSSEHVWIHHCSVHNGDDGIAVKSGLDAAGRAFGRPSRHILVEDCRFRFGDGLSIGSEMSGGVQNVTFRRNRLELASSTTYLKTSAARGGYIRDVLFEQISADASHVVRLRTSYDHAPPAPTLPTIDNVTWRGIDADALRAGMLECSAAIPCTRLTFDDVRVTSLLGYECSHAYGTQSRSSPSICIQQQ